MSASAHVMQMVRAHYQRDEAAFMGAASALARASKNAVIRARLSEAIKRGYESRPNGTSSSFRQPQVLPNVSGLLQPLAPITFPDLLLDPSLQLLLDEIVVELEYREELAARKLRARNRLLFWGPPGNGKTSVAAAMGNALDVPAYGLSLPHVIGSHLGETGNNLGKVFASLGHDTLIVFDEIDALGSRRGAGEQACDKEMNSTVNTMLTLLDRNKQGIVIATTNRPDILDPALLRRFDEQIEFPAPSIGQMRALAAKLSEHYGIPEVDITGTQNFDAVAKRVETEARRIVMKELLAADAEEDSDEAAE